MVLPRDPSVVTLPLKPVPQAALLAREAVENAFRSWGYGDHIDAGKLVANELVANAVAASAPDQEITMRTFLGDEGKPVVEVWDAVDEEPELRHPADDDESGRGLILIAALANRWGTNPLVGGGKVVWAEIG